MAAGLTFNVFGHDVSASSTLHKVEGEADKSSKKIGSSFKTAGKVIAGAFASVAVVNFFKSSIDEATEAQKVGAQTATVLKSTGGAANVTAQQIGDLATAISNKAGIDDEAIQSGENLLLTFTNIRNEAGKGNDIFNQTTSIMTDLSVATGQSMKTSAIQLGKALNDPIKGVSALQRVGVSFSATQKAQIKRLVETGHSMKAQKVILAELNKEFKGSAEAQATPAEKAKVAWGNLQEQIGTYLLPIIAQLATFLTQHVIPAMATVAGWIKKNSGWLVPLAAAIGAVVLALKAWTVAQAIWNAVMLMNPIVLIIAAIIALGVALVVAYKKSETFRNVVNAVFRAIKTVIMSVWNVIRPIFHLWLMQWVLLWRGAQSMWGILRNIFNALRSAFQAVGRTFSNVAGGIRDAFTNVRNWARDRISDVIGFFRDLPGKIRDLGGRMFSAGVHLMGQVFSGIRNAVGSAGGFVADLGRDIVNAVIRGLNAILPHKIHIHIPIPLAPDVNLDIPLIPNIPYLAQGTGFFKGGLAVLGDRGPELVNLPPGAKVGSASMTASQARMAGGGGVNVNVYVNGALSTDRDIRRAVVAGLEQAVNSDGLKLNIRSGIR